ncbi:MAG: dihydropteroate synthase [Chloracidobacterium sp.]|nr:dihydropteroate synthase [Chloracidobacterium sp.]
MKYWQTSRRKISLEQPLVMGILNVTPDSFSDGGEFLSVDDALRHAEAMIADGADIIDVGGESTRPGSGQVSGDDEIHRVVPVIEAITKRFDTPVSIDTTKSEVAVASVDAGAEIINDISGLRFDKGIAAVAARTNAGLVLMHSRGDFLTMHSQPPVEDIVADVTAGLARALEIAMAHGVRCEQIAVDVGIGFGKTQEQNLELLAKLGNIVSEFIAYPMLIGTSRKSFLTRILGDVPPAERTGGSLATALVAIRNGAKILRVHDVRETVSAIKTTVAISGVK